MSTKNSRFYISRNPYSCQTTAFVMNPTANVAPNSDLFTQSFSGRFLTIATDIVFFARAFRRLTMVKQNCRLLCGMILTMVVVVSVIDEAIWRFHYWVQDIIQRGFHRLRLSYFSLLMPLFSKSCFGKRKRLTKSRLKLSTFLLGFRVSEKKLSLPILCLCRVGRFSQKCCW